MKKLFGNKLCALTFCALGLAFSGSALALDKSKTYIVGTEATYAPYEYLSDKGEVVGFDIDLINYVCEQIGITCKVENQAFDGLFSNLNFKKIDMVIAGVHPTEARLKVAAFSNEYLPKEKNVYLVLKANNFNDVSELKNVGTQAGTSQAVYLDTKTKYKVVKYQTNDLAYLDLRAKRIDAYLLSEEVAKPIINSNQDFTTVGEPLTDPIFGLTGPAIAVHKQNKELLEAINQALATAQESGFLAQLKAKYGMN
ncbi:transporter substrate-binding domain-containing protein [Psittacicella gerlachiana]|uniref:Solute-binding protein family 3/N-terminal domain-containing protein n=1 Tax=Psittacicella gerlachiana TaxID=2028574 RepID=A0A3A1Y9Z8_9GAMM|nr:transporter substrate-binding domain-containing protein [Psittacicella gerlachiana]RIY35133.1 hypothetical protein CKF59_04100 [Psittacicella gerlachiana]